MADKVLLLGHDREGGARLAGILAGLGYQPVAAAWGGFSPRAFGRDRPRLVLADMDSPAAEAMEDLCRLTRKYWGESYPIVAVTGSGLFQRLSGFLDAGADACLSPRSDAEVVERKLARCLASSRPTAIPEEVDDVPQSLQAIFAGRGDLIRLGDLVSVHAGATPRKPSFRRMAPPDQEWRGVLTSAVVGRFYVGRPDAYLRWSRVHLFRLPPPGEYAVAEKVLLRRAGPPLAAAVDRSRLPAGTDVYSLIPREGVGAGFVACLLNSRLLDFYFNRLAGVGSDGRLRIEDVSEAPVPRPTAAAMQECARAAALLAHYGPSPQTWIDRQSKDDLLERMEDNVFALYGADVGAREELAAMHF